MVKPPPTRTSAKPPVTPPSVEAPSTGPAEAKAVPLSPAAAGASPAAAGASPAAAAPSRAQPAPAAAKATPSAPVEKSSTRTPRKPPKRVASAKLRIGKPVAKRVAPKKPMESARPPKPVVSKAVGTKPVENRSAQAKSVRQPKPVTAAVRKPAEAAPPATKVTAAPASLEFLPLPPPPEFAMVTSETVMSQALTMARAFGALQARMLDHACTELRATLSEAETLARSESASEAITLQAKAVRRSYESYAEHLKELARIANAALRKD